MATFRFICRTFESFSKKANSRISSRIRVPKSKLSNIDIDINVILILYLNLHFVGTSAMNFQISVQKFQIWIQKFNLKFFISNSKISNFQDS